LRKKIILISIASFLIISTAIVTIVILKTGKPPVFTVEKARKEYSKARKAGAEIFSNKLFEQSRRDYNAAMLAWRVENEKFILKRDYHKVDSLAKSAEKYAMKAHDEAVEKSSGLRKAIQLKMDEIKKLIEEKQALFSFLPLDQAMVKNNARGRLFLSEANIAFNQGKFTTCDSKLDKAKELLADSYNKSEKLLNNYFSEYKSWKLWAKKTIDESLANDDYAIIIDKFSRECFIYQSGKQLTKFDIELGKNWMENKKRKGDDATPEGFYKVVAKKENPKTKYYKALLLDYPNGEDKKRFELNKLKGLLRKNDQIGNLIEIHGDGGKGIDWTNGCIALTNKDMDKVFKIASKGTPVTIVGSLRSLEEVIEDIKSN
jgi:hypothetical protein